MIVDFHSHTYYSDGSLSASALHKLMRARGVEIYAISDHDTLAAHTLEPLAEHELDGPRRIVGVEINTTYADNEVHVLGYGFLARGSALDATLADNRESRLTRVEIMLTQLAAAGMPLEYDAVLDAAGVAETIGRPHVAKAMVKAGYAKDVHTAIKKFLRQGGVGYVASLAISPFEAIEAIHAAGGVAVLAHPCRLNDYGIIEILARAGMDGLEVYYPRHTAAQMDLFRNEAEKFGLFITAGADFHDPSHNPRGVGMEVIAEDLKPFLEIVL